MAMLLSVDRVIQFHQLTNPDASETPENLAVLGSHDWDMLNFQHVICTRWAFRADGYEWSYTTPI